MAISNIVEKVYYDVNLVQNHSLVYVGRFPNAKSTTLSKDFWKNNLKIYWSKYQIKETQSRDIELLRASYCVYKTLPYCFTVQFFRLLCKFGKTDIALAFDEPSKIAPIEIWHAQASEVEKMKYIKLFNLYFDDKKYNLINDLILNDVDIEMLRNKNFLEIFNIFNSEMLTK